MVLLIKLVIGFIKGLKTLSSAPPITFNKPTEVKPLTEVKSEVVILLKPCECDSILDFLSLP